MTQEFVTLPREVVERAMNALEFSETQSHRLQYDVEASALAALSAAMEHPQAEQEPVAIVREMMGGFVILEKDLPIGAEPKFKAGDYLYTRQQPKREPLTDEQIAEVLIDETNRRSTGIGFKTLRAFARAIEAAHNIK